MRRDPRTSWEKTQRIRWSAFLLAAFVALAPLDANAQFVFGSSTSCGPLSLYVRELVLNGVTTLDAVDSGWYDSDGVHDPSNLNYIVSLPGAAGPEQHHNFFVFEIPTGQFFTSATLRIFNTGGFPCPDGYSSPNPTELYEVYDVTTPVPTLVSSSGGGHIAIFLDLGGGTLFGSQTVSAADNGAIVSVALNSDAVAAINAAAGTQFAVGGALAPPDSDSPITSNVIPSPNPASIDEVITLTARIDDSTTGGSDIASADFEIRDSNGAVVLAGDSGACPDPYSLCAIDVNGSPDSFDSVMEDVRVTIAAGTLSPDVYQACIRGTDSNGNTGEFECAFLPVYDPDAGFVTGGGWIYSEAGFCSLNALCADAEGKANFGFVSKYKKGANVPTGQTQFQFKAGGLNFHGAEYQWLVVSGAMAQYKGSGTINGSGDYGFLLTAQDSAINGGPAEDTFRIKIWEKATEMIVYDNGTDQPIGGGNIIIHKN